MNEIFEVWWPKLDERLLAIPKTQIEEREPKKKPRPDKELLEEILTIVRDQSSYLSRLSGSNENYDPNRNSPNADKLEDQLRNLAGKGAVLILPYDPQSNDLSRIKLIKGCYDASFNEMNSRELNKHTNLEIFPQDKNAANRDKQNKKINRGDLTKNIYR